MTHYIYAVICALSLTFVIVLSLFYIFVMNDCMPWPVLDFYALALLDTCVLCITLPAVKKGLAFCCIDWTRYTPALTSSTGAAKRANLASCLELPTTTPPHHVHISMLIQFVHKSHRIGEDSF